MSFFWLAVPQFGSTSVLGLWIPTFHQMGGLVKDQSFFSVFRTVVLGEGSWRGSTSLPPPKKGADPLQDSPKMIQGVSVTPLRSQFAFLCVLFTPSNAALCVDCTEGHSDPQNSDPQSKIHKHNPGLHVHPDVKGVCRLLVAMVEQTFCNLFAAAVQCYTPVS